MKFDFETMKWQGITITDLQRWESLFPDVDVVHEIKIEMLIWLEKNQNRKVAHKKNWTKFILNWLQGEQEKNIGRLQ